MPCACLAVWRLEQSAGSSVTGVPGATDDLLELGAETRFSSEAQVLLITDPFLKGLNSLLSAINELFRGDN